jgi:hypothetical protein
LRVADVATSQMTASSAARSGSSESQALRARQAIRRHCRLRDSGYACDAQSLKDVPMCKTSPSSVTAIPLPPGSMIRKLKFVRIDLSEQALGGATHAVDQTISSLELMIVVVVIQHHTLGPSTSCDAM